jgi:hypothetical protein
MKSLIIYFFSFFISVFIAKIYEKKRDKDTSDKKIKQLLKKFLWISLIIIFPVLVATFRYNTGTDYNIYRLFYYYNELNGLKYFIRVDGTITEYLSWLVLEISRIIFGNLNGYFFLSSFITLFFFTLAIDNFKDKINMPFALFIFYLFIYPITLNLVRQMMAVAICLQIFI